MKKLGNISSAVMAQRRNSLHGTLDYFPSPPWSTRAFVEHVLRKYHADLAGMTCWEPAAGEGHMAEVLKEYFQDVWASDVHDYGKGYAVGDFAAEASLARDRVEWPAQRRKPEFVITNPPYNLALPFALRALKEARRGVGLLVRTAWLESEERFSCLFKRRPPTAVAIYSERVAMIEGRWDPRATTATSYAFIYWNLNRLKRQQTVFMWIPPGSKSLYTKKSDIQRFFVEPLVVADERAATLFAAE